MSGKSISFDIEFGKYKKNFNVVAIFDYDNVFTKCRGTRKVYFNITPTKGELYRNDLKPYIEFLIKHNILNESTLTLTQDKLLKYLVFGYPKSYPHTKKGIPPGISRYFHRQNYDRYCLAKDSERSIEKIMNGNSSIYPNRLLAPQESGTTTLILGSSFTGKTFLLSNEIDLIRPFEYDLIILFTESVNVPSLSKIKNRPDIIVKEGFDPKIPAFLKNLNSKLGNRYKFLLILDDIISEKSTRKTTLGKMITTYRNSNISTVVLAQYPTIIAKESRTNFHQLVITGMRSPESNKSLTDRFDILYWAKDRMQHESPWKEGGKITNDDVYSYLKKLLMDNGVVLYIDLKRSKDPSLIDLN